MYKLPINSSANSKFEVTPSFLISINFGACLPLSDECELVYETCDHEDTDNYKPSFSRTPTQVLS